MLLTYLLKHEFPTDESSNQHQEYRARLSKKKNRIYKEKVWCVLYSYDLVYAIVSAFVFSLLSFHIGVNNLLFNVHKKYCKSTYIRDDFILRF